MSDNGRMYGAKLSIVGVTSDVVMATCKACEKTTGGREANQFTQNNLPQQSHGSGAYIG